ncbi:MAG: M2 family metallopeptidase [Phycisphaerae bacterium]
MRRILILLGFLGALSVVAEAEQGSRSADHEFRVLRDAYLAKFKPLWLQSQAAWWEANTTGSEAAFARKKTADKALVELHSDGGMFARISALREQGRVSDPVLRRQLDVMYRTFLPGQADTDLQKRIVELESDVEQIFNTHRSRVGERVLTENDVREIVATTTDPSETEVAWKAYMQVGRKVEAKLSELVRLRNEMARQLGFRSYYSMRLVLQEIDEEELFRLFDELDALTREPFAELKREIDAARAARFRIPIAELRPWHYGDLFFQEVPGGRDVDLDELFKDADLVGLAKTYYAGIGLPCGDVLARSDLYEKPGKSPHAFCTDLDRAGDIRVLCNLKPNAYWADTLLHELGHAVYDKYIRRDVPFLLRQASHGITTEGIAMMFGALVKNEDWLTGVLKVDPRQAARVGRAARESLRAEKLIFSRWTQVMVRFERGMYTNPQQNLGKLWWGLKKRYQLLNPPETVDRPDYAAKAHILTTPVYYHNYQLGDLFAAQVRHHLAREILGLEGPNETSFRGRPLVGAYLCEKIFGPGNLDSWNELTELATGEPLTAKYFAEGFIE